MNKTSTALDNIFQPVIDVIWNAIYFIVIIAIIFLAGKLLWKYYLKDLINK
ncbi:MAG TPA: hypothetical protein VIG40_06755 [Tissierellaceae bacterium]